MKKIALTQGQFALVDDYDFEWVNQWKWSAAWMPGTRSYYAYRKSRKGEPYPPRTNIYMHRQIMGAIRGQLVDHRDTWNTLDNRRGNLRFATRSQNAHNSRGRRDSASRLKGAFYFKNSRKWQSRIMVNGEKFYLGVFDTAQAAHEAYMAASDLMCGEFSRSG